MDDKQKKQMLSWIERATTHGDEAMVRPVLSWGCIRPDNMGEIMIGADGYRLHVLWHETGALDGTSTPSLHDDKRIFFKGSKPEALPNKYPNFQPIFDYIFHLPVATFPIKHLYKMCKQNKSFNDNLELDFDAGKFCFSADLAGFTTSIDYAGQQLQGSIVLQSNYLLDALSYFSAIRTAHVELRFNIEKRAVGIGTLGNAFALIMGMSKTK